ncbi:MAG: RNA helicase domain-containing protein [Firmicutes bacterium]|nr:RNA helicase domain-containing protein [Bacillota bacterium]
MEKYGYENVFRITNYERGMFDAYKGQDVIIFEEFRSSLKVEEMLNLLDGYPLQLPCRFQDKVACYTKAYLITNIQFNEQYKNIQLEQPKTWEAFKRRVHKIIDFDKTQTTTPAQMELIPIDDDDMPF